LLEPVPRRGNEYCVEGLVGYGQVFSATAERVNAGTSSLEHRTHVVIGFDHGNVRAKFLEQSCP
jgi:hypothetical protein